MVFENAASGDWSKEVLYIGSAVPLETSEGLEAIQQPLRSRYPIDNDDHIEGVISTLSIVPSGIQLRFKNDPSLLILFSFSGLTMCAAVRCVKVINAVTNEVNARFVSLSSPEAGGANSRRPAIFTAIARRSKGRQVLECHNFITMTPKDALDLVQWTSALDRRSKHGGLETMRTGAGSSTNDISKGDTSFYGESASFGDYPVHLVPGEPATHAASSSLFKEPPPNGYFYSTKQSLVKRYSLQKFGGSTGHEDTPSVIPVGADHFERRSGYSGSHHSANTANFPTQTRLVPVRTYMPPPAPPLMRPVFVAPPPPPTVLAYPRPRFFSPPPAVRVRPVPVFVPPPIPTAYSSPFPVAYNEGPYLRAPVGRRGSRGSSRSSSSSSLLESPQLNGKPHRKAHPNTHDDTSESTSRPQTPPTDYDVPRGPRVSRREDFYLRQHMSRDPRVVGQRGYYVAPPYGYYSLPPPGGQSRPRSVPSYVDRTSTKAKKSKSKKNKKEKKKSHKKGSTDERHDESTDSVGYMSELGPNVPRDFRRLENQYKHERAFSKSLAEETKHSVQGHAAYNAYSLSHTGGNENEFPPTVY